MPLAHLTHGEDRYLDVAPDVRLRYQVYGRSDPQAAVLMLANGLGGRIYAWEPLLKRFGDRFRILTWDYRGLFGSTRPSNTTGMSVPHHAQDAVRILDHEGVDQAVLIGWSMGVQLGLHIALEFPQRIKALVLLNGTYGQIFRTALQPLVRAPGIPTLLHAVVERLVQRDRPLVRLIQTLALNELHLSLVGRLLVRWRKNPALAPLYRQYYEDVFGDSFINYLRLFQVLDAHSVYHLLPEVAQPTLVISGGLDWLTPPKMSFEIARRIPRAEHLHIRFGSHFVIIEHSERVLRRISEFLATHG